MTEANTRERIELLSKVKTASQYFHVTNGGGPMSSNDALMAWATKDMERKAAIMSKRKEALEGFRQTNQKVTELLAKKPLQEWRSWTVAELKLIVAWKQGHSPKEPYNDSFKGMKKPALQQLFEDKYESAPDPIDSVWTDEMEAELNKLKSGEISDVYVDCGILRAMERDEEEITTRLKNKVPSSRMKILTNTFCSLTKRARRELLDELALMADVDDDDSVAEVNSDIFDEDESDNDFP